MAVLGNARIGLFKYTGIEHSIILGNFHWDKLYTHILLDNSRD